MASILVMGGFSPAIWILGGRELGGEGVRTGVTVGIKREELGVGTVVEKIIGGGVLNPGVGKYPNFLGLDQGKV
jgi:hypothetical protein